METGLVDSCAGPLQQWALREGTGEELGGEGWEGSSYFAWMSGIVERPIETG